MAKISNQQLHLQRVRDFFASLPPLHPDTVDIILRSHLDVPEELMPAARAEVAHQHQTAKAA